MRLHVSLYIYAQCTALDFVLENKYAEKTTKTLAFIAKAGVFVTRLYKQTRNRFVPSIRFSDEYAVVFCRGKMKTRRSRSSRHQNFRKLYQSLYLLLIQMLSCDDMCETCITGDVRRIYTLRHCIHCIQCIMFVGWLKARCGIYICICV